MPLPRFSLGTWVAITSRLVFLPLGCFLVDFLTFLVDFLPPFLVVFLVGFLVVLGLPPFLVVVGVATGVVATPAP